jgi:hypothetical protein
MVIPLDFTVRRPDPIGPGRPCYDKLTLLRIMINRTWSELQERGLRLSSSLMVADSWFGDSSLLEEVLANHHITLIVEGKQSYVFYLPDGKDFVNTEEWPWRRSSQVPKVEYARLTVTSPTYGSVIVTLVNEPGQDRYYLLCQVTHISSPRLIRAFNKRFWIEWAFRSLKTLLGTGSCQMHREDSYYGHFFFRLMALTVLAYTVRKLLRSKVTMERVIFCLKHY